MDEKFRKQSAKALRGLPRRNANAEAIECCFGFENLRFECPKSGHIAVRVNVKGGGTTKWSMDV